MYRLNNWGIYDDICSTRYLFNESHIIIYLNYWGGTYNPILKGLDHFGRTTEAKHLTEENAWTKDYDWRGNADSSHRHFFINKITNERRSLTEEQYNDDNYTLNTWPGNMDSVG